MLITFRGDSERYRLVANRDKLEGFLATLPSGAMTPAAMADRLAAAGFQVTRQAVVRADAAGFVELLRRDEDRNRAQAAAEVDAGWLGRGN